MGNNVVMVNQENLDRMVEFVVGSNPVRFDEYMEEHILGKQGFYSKNVKIGADGHFYTKSLNPAFAHLIHLMILNSGLSGKDFLEIGGGNGEFKKNFLIHSPTTNYISVDASNALIKKQKDFDGKVILGNVDNLSLKNESIDGVVFSNELIDELPCRIFRISNRGKNPRIIEEGYVTFKDNQLRLIYLEAQKDEFAKEYEVFLSEKRSSIYDGSIISVSPMTERAVSEMKRVLKQGKIILIDYGYWNSSLLSFERKNEELPFYRNNGKFSSVGEILKNPYSVDLTYNVDFEFLEWLAEKKNFSSTNLNYQHSVFKRVGYQNKISGENYDRLLYIGNFLILEMNLDKGK